jgi:hypothetical protein
VVLLGTSPQPVNRDFRLLNTTGGDVDVLLDLECVAVRTSKALDQVLTVVNTAGVATTTYDADASNDTSSATVTVARAAGSVTPTPIPTPTPTPVPIPVAPSSVVKAFQVGSAGRGANVRVACQGTGVCTGTVRLTAVVPQRYARAKRVVIGSARYRVVGGHTERVRVTIKKKFRKLVRQDRVRRIRVS